MTFTVGQDTSRGTDDVNPSPPTGIVRSVRALRHDRHDHNDHRKEATTEYARHRLRDPLLLADLEAPEHAPELTVSNQGQDNPMRRERHIVEPHRRLRAERVARRILPPDERGEEEARGRNGVADEAEDVDGWEVDGETVRGAALVVEDGLRVEGGRPTQEAFVIRSRQRVLVILS